MGIVAHGAVTGLAAVRSLSPLPFITNTIASARMQAAPRMAKMSGLFDLPPLF